jgi:hypothetical protein
MYMQNIIDSSRPSIHKDRSISFPVLEQRDLERDSVLATRSSAVTTERVTDQSSAVRFGGLRGPTSGIRGHQGME